ncbi:MAG: type II toxin-antitoxin system HicA family toxin [Planctomycetes bacterium]|nr:type II toxin-antitoxin system HicA family toxin [Planctomycetota bacterium]
MTDTARNLIRVLKKVGFTLVREGPRHTVLRRGDQIITVWRHTRDLPTGTFHGTLRDAGLSVEDYFRLR